MSTATMEASAEIAEIVKAYPPSRGSLIPVLQDIQGRFGFLSEDAIDALDEHMGISANEVYGVATFYTQFRFSPPGDHIIQVCQGTACHVRGGLQVLREFETQLGVSAGETTADQKFQLERVACLGCCALAPVVAVDGKVYSGVTPRKIPKILAKYRDK